MTYFLKVKLKPLPDILLLFGLCLCSFFLVMRSGSRGFFAFDQSIVFDGSYRVLSGQVPYRDFFIPVGPVAFWLHAAFFWLLGVSFRSYLAGAAVINALAALAAVHIVRMLQPGRRLLSYVAGGITAVWFYPPSGTPWVDQTAFFFSLLGLESALAALLSWQRSRRTELMLFCVAGLCAFLSFISKQNAGLYLLPLYICLAVLARKGRTAIPAFLAGFLAAGAAFTFWLFAVSDSGSFLRSFFITPSLLGACRLMEEGLPSLLKSSLGLPCDYTPIHLLPSGIRAVFFCSLVFALWAILGKALRRGGKAGTPHEEIAYASLLCIYLVFAQYLFIHTTMNQAENGVPFTGIIIALAAGIGFSIIGNAHRFLKSSLALAVAVAVLYILLQGMQAALSRRVQELAGARNYLPLTVAGLEALRWGEPTPSGNAAVSARDIDELAAYLRERKANFFVFPSFSIFYGLLGVPSPQPLLWFHKGLTYDVRYDAALDSRLVDDLKKSSVEVIVLEQEPAYSRATLSDFPLLRAFIFGDFSSKGRIGIFELFEKNR